MSAVYDLQFNSLLSSIDPADPDILVLCAEIMGVDENKLEWCCCEAMA